MHDLYIADIYRPGAILLPFPPFTHHSIVFKPSPEVSPCDLEYWSGSRKTRVPGPPGARVQTAWSYITIVDLHMVAASDG